jgi:hypothetical protein
MAGRSCWRWSIPSGVILVSLGLGSPNSAQAVHPFAREARLERAAALAAEESVTFEGVVYDPSGAPAEGAVVVSSAGGQAVTGRNGTYRLEARVPDGAGSVQITAVGRAGGSLLASTLVALAAATGPVRVGPLQLAQGSACSPSWLPTFGGVPGVGDRVHALTVFDDGGGPALYAGGNFTAAGGVLANYVARWDGSTWAALASGTNGRVNALSVFDDGGGPALYAGGAFTTAGGLGASNIAKWDGSGWAALSSGLSGEVHALTVFDGDGEPALYAGGAFITAGGVVANHVAAWDGSTWASVGEGMDGDVLALAVYDDGLGRALYAGGAFTYAGGAEANFVAQWNGSSWTPLGSGMAGAYPVVHALAVFDDGGGPALYAGGGFASAGSVVAKSIARWNGSSWSAVGGGSSGATVYALGVFDDGGGPALYAGGDIATAGGVVANSIARWDGSSWSALGSGLTGGGKNVLALAGFDDGGGPALYAGGNIGSAGGVTAAGIAKWDGSTWAALGSGLNNAVYSLAVFDDGGGPALHAAGLFTSAGGVMASHIAKWDGSTWAALGSGLGGSSSNVLALAVFDDGGGPALYAGGTFTTAGGVAANHIAEWDGSSWSALGSGMNSGGYVRALTVFDDGGGPALYAGGDFTKAGGLTANHVARWNGSSWAALGSGTNSGVSALTVFDDGAGPMLHAGGKFTTAGGVVANRIAKWDGSSWAPLGSGMGANQVLALAVFDDGGGPMLVAGGDFTTAGGMAASRIARWDGASWAALGTGMNDEVHALAVFDDGGGPALHAGGDFTTAGGVAVSRIAKWDGASWAPLGSGTNGDVYALTAFDSGGLPALFAGGVFQIAIDSGDSRLAKWGCPVSSSGTVYCTAGTTTSGCVPAISGTGNASASAGAGFTISIAEVEGQKAGLLFYGVTGAKSAPWGAGTSYLCVKTPAQRMSKQDSGGTAGACDGVLSEDWNAYIAAHPNALGQPFAAGATVWAQGWFRDPPAPKSTNLSDALVFQLLP